MATSAASRHPPGHPGSWLQEAEQVIPKRPLCSGNHFQLFIGDLQAFPDQMEHLIPPVSSQSALAPLDAEEQQVSSDFSRKGASC